MENSIGRICAINPAIQKIRLSNRAPWLSVKKWVCNSITLYHYTLFPTVSKTLDNILSKEKHKMCLCYRTEAIMHAWQIVTYMVLKKGLKHKGEQR